MLLLLHFLTNLGNIFRILTTLASSSGSENAQHSLLASFFRYNSKYRDYLLGQKWVVMVPALLYPT